VKWIPELPARGAAEGRPRAGAPTPTIRSATAPAPTVRSPSQRASAHACAARRRPGGVLGAFAPPFVGRWASLPTKPAKACQTPRRVIRRWNGLRRTLVTVGFAVPSAVKADAFWREGLHLSARGLAMGRALAVGEKGTAGHARSATVAGFSDPTGDGQGPSLDGELQWMSSVEHPARAAVIVSTSTRRAWPNTGAEPLAAPRYLELPQALRRRGRPDTNPPNPGGTLAYPSGTRRALGRLRAIDAHSDHNGAKGLLHSLCWAKACGFS